MKVGKSHILARKEKQKREHDVERASSALKENGLQAAEGGQAERAFLGGSRRKHEQVRGH